MGTAPARMKTASPALNIAAAVMQVARSRGHEIKILNIGGGFPVPYDACVNPFPVLARKINSEIDDLLYSENIGAYSNVSATHFNGFEPAQVVHVNE
jgi:ornithine decarboxylase